MKRETVIFTLISILTVLALALGFVTIEKNQTLELKIAEQQKEISAKDLRIKDLMNANQTLDALVRQQNRLIEGESLGDFMAMYDANKVASKVEILVHLKDSESGLPMRFLIEGSSVCNEQEKEL